MKIIDIIGDTPVVELTSFSVNPKVKIYAKLEGTNLGGSIKDRTVKYLMQTLTAADKNKTLIEATSGNTGIAMAMLATNLGMKFLAVMPDNASIERRKLMQLFGAEILLTEGKLTTNYSITIARNMLAEEPERFVSLDQFKNLANIRAHYETTGVEIARQVPQITHLVAGMGTGGTLTGTGRKLKKLIKGVKIVGLEPALDAPIPGLRNMSAYKPDTFDPTVLDERMMITDSAEIQALTKEIHLREGLGVGPSSGAALWGALKLARQITSGVIVAIFPDRSDRYLSLIG